MKIFFGEFKADYPRYHFPYQVWLLKEEGDDIDKIYSSGFLPMRSLKNIFYLSRNIRVQLDKFELSSENRRILGKTSFFDFKLIKLKEYPYDFTVQKFCKDYCDNRFGKGYISTIGIRKIFNDSNFNYVFEFKSREKTNMAGLAVCYIDNDILHYAHSYYDLEYLKDSLGSGMMLKTIEWAKQENKKYVYLGTCYEKNSLYKTEFKGLEFFNGFTWSENLEELKELISMDHNDYLLKDKLYLQKYYEEDIYALLNKFGYRVNF